MKSSWDTAKNILCVRLDHMGDLLMTTPAIRALKTSAPGRKVTLLTSWASAEVARYVPEVDVVMRYDAPWMKSTGVRDRTADLMVIELLRRQRFDAAIIFTVYSQNPLPAALLCFLSEIPLRLAHCRENPYQLLTHWVQETEPEHRIRHEVQRQLDLVASIGCYTANNQLSFRVAAPDAAQALDKLEQAGVDISRPWVVVHPGASAPSRRYPSNQFAIATSLLARDHQIVFTGDNAEVTLVEDIRKAMHGRSYTLAGNLSLGEFAALISLSSLLICNNTGPVHIAAALGIPIVDLYALTNPQHTPWRVPHRLLFHDVPCKYCYKSICPQGHHDCLRRVKPEQVASAAQMLLNNASNRTYASTDEKVIPLVRRSARGEKRDSTCTP